MGMQFNDRGLKPQQILRLPFAMAATQGSHMDAAQTDHMGWEIPGKTFPEAEITSHSLRAHLPRAANTNVPRCFPISASSEISS